MPRVAVLLLVALASIVVAADKPVSPPAAPAVPAGYYRTTIGQHNFTLPVGFTIELVAASPQVDRPVTAAFDDKGRLFVADSSGSNARPADQLKNPTHRVVMLESTKKDGKFDKSTVFADKLSFLQGTMWHAGSLFVATPPTIQKLTDTDGDGIADKREVWFDGGVLTGCANDVHGPYPGPDGRIYFTKGAFAKQELTLGSGKKFVTRAAHIYSAKPDGTDLRVEMTGGMDNPVDVAFNPAGEMFFTTTFLQHPANGRRDGIIHATYGAVYGKDHDPLTDHVRTRPELSEPMTHLGPAAPAGLHCYRSGEFGADYAGNLFACQFNLAKVSRHILKEKGSTYETVDSDFVASDNRDFHPTDVIEDADGSLLIVDTGGWYKLCCPSSVFEKKDILGGIYRVKRDGKHIAGKPAPTVIAAPDDDIQVIPLDVLGGLHGREKETKEWLRKELKSNSSHARRRAATKIGREKRIDFTADLFNALPDEKNDAVLDTALTRALIDIGDPKATAWGLKHQSPRVKRAALAALDQMPNSKLTADDVIPHLNAENADLRNTAWWIAGRHEDWGDKLVGYFREQLRPGTDSSELTVRLAKFANGAAVQKLLAEAVADPQTEFTALTAMLLARPKALPVAWKDPLADALTRKHTALAFAVLKAGNVSAADYTAITSRAKQSLSTPGFSWDSSDTLHFLASAPANAVAPTDDQFALAVKRVREAGTSSATASLARDALVRSKLSAGQLEQLASVLPEVSPVYLPDLLAAFTRSSDEKAGFALVSALRTPKLRAVVRLDQVKPIFDKYPKAVQEVAAKLYADLEEATKEQRQKLDTILANTQPGDVRRGHQVFGSAKAACVTCHKVAYVGGAVGPDLTKIGAIRSERDLLESIVFPSASFVRSYEPVKVQTTDGKTFSGILKSDAADEVVLTVNATDEVRLSRKDIDEITPGTVSVMPTGLDQQLTPQELADLVAFLKSLK